MFAFIIYSDYVFVCVSFVCRVLFGAVFRVEVRVCDCFHSQCQILYLPLCLSLPSLFIQMMFVLSIIVRVTFGFPSEPGSEFVRSFIANARFCIYLHG